MGRHEKDEAARAARGTALSAVPLALVLVVTLCTTALARPAELRGFTNALSSGSGSLTGTVTNAATGKPIENVHVSAEVPGVAYGTSTGANGEYHIRFLPGGQYRVQFDAREQNFVIQYYNARSSEAEADLVNVTEGATTSGIDAALKVGGIIKGKTTSAATSKGLGGVSVCVARVQNPHEPYGHCATSEESGDYVIEGLESGEYTVQFWAPRQNYLRQYYNGQSAAAQANPVKVTAGQIVSGVDAAMQVGGEIAGTVTAGGAPREGVEVCAIPLGEEPWQGECAHTQAGGSYSISALPSGEYKVAFHGTGNFLSQYYKRRATFAEADAVKVTAGSATTGIDATLQEGGRVTGKVTDATTGAPIEGVEACAEAPQGGRACGETNAAGAYTITGLASGTYAIAFQPSNKNYLFEYYGGVRYQSEATKVKVLPELTVAGIDVALQPGGEITGTVVDQSTGVPIQGAQVCARGVFASFFERECASSGAGGAYTVIKLRIGAYDVEFSAPGFATQYYNEADSQSQAEPVAVTAGAVTREINAALQPGASIAGKVTSAATGTPLAEISACAYAANGEGVGGCARTDASGEYTITGLAARDYIVSFSGANYPTQYYAGTFSYAEAKRVSIAAGVTTASINDALRGGGTIAGSVTAALSGAPLEGVRVCASLFSRAPTCTQSGPSGRYSISGLAPWPYTVGFESVKGYLAASVDKVAVSAEATTAGVDAAMPLGGRITGQVREATSGNPLSHVQVCAYAQTEYSLSPTCAETDTGGSYTIEGLATSGEWIVGFSLRGGNLAGQFFAGAPLIEDATLVSVIAGKTTEGVNATLVAGGQISGTVTDAAGNPLEGVEVCVTPTTEEPYAVHCAHDDASGAYTVSALASGQYKVAFYDFAKGYHAEYYRGVYWAISATPVSVIAGARSEGIDAQLRTGGAITGTVTDAATGLPLAGIAACPRAIPPEGELPVVSFPPFCPLTSAKGEYVLSGLTPGEYELSFSSLNHAFASQTRTQKVIVVAEMTNMGIDAAMVPGGKISGTVTDEAGASLRGALVCASGEASAHYVGGCATTNAKGDYTIAGLEAATYEVSFNVSRETPASQYYDGVLRRSEASRVTVAAGGHVTGINARLSKGGEITGRVTSAEDGEPVRFGFVCAYGEVEGETGPSSCTTIDENGDYTIVGLPSSSYKVHFSGESGEAPQYFGGVYLAQEATPVVVSAGSTRSGIDGALRRGGAIRGKVTAAASGKNVAGVTVCATLVGGEPDIGGCARTSISGRYTITGLDPGSYVVKFADRGRYDTEFYDGASAAAEASAVTVSLGVATEGIDEEMVATNAAPANLVPPVISGSASVGSTLSCSNGTWSGSQPLMFSTRWLRDGVPLPGATGTTYAVTGADQGQQISCEVTAINSRGSASATSTAVSVPPSGKQAERGPTPGNGASALAGNGGSSGVGGYKAAAPVPHVLTGPISIRRGVLFVPLRCTATSGKCPQVSVSVSVVETLAGGRVIAVRASSRAHGRGIKRIVAIGSVTATLSAGRSADVPVHLDATGKHLLHRWRRLAALVQVTAESHVLASRVVHLHTAEPRL
jgi:hypothetical protein